MKGIYLCARCHRIPGYDIDYNDIEPLPGINIQCSCENIKLEKYDFIIATPPCNYWSRANYRRDKSKVAQLTKHLLIYCLKECIKSGKPFIVENVLIPNYLRPKEFDSYKFTYGTHTFWTNVLLPNPGKPIKPGKWKNYKSYGKRDDNIQVDYIIRLFLSTIKDINTL